AIFTRIGHDTSSPEEEVRMVRESLTMAKNQLTEPFFCRRYLKPILLAFAIATFNQLSGVNALLYYSKRIFEMAGMTGDVALLSSVIVGFTNLVFTMAAMAIIDFFGRKRLMLVGSIGYILSLSVVAWAFFHFGVTTTDPGTGREIIQLTAPGGTLVLGCILVFIASHAFGQGAVIWVFIGEIFPNLVRARGQALGSFTHWFWCAVISWTFPLIAEQSGGYAFATYAVCMVFQLLWVIFVMPETKNVPLEELERRICE
ncbi:MAG: MFS transporter, partial [Planctomycetia bacterium]|nr:MFS transporter [Planctomycetia bacterium]